MESWIRYSPLSGSSGLLAPALFYLEDLFRMGYYDEDALGLPGIPGYLLEL